MQAIVFDFDGVFIDTEILKTESYFDRMTDPQGAYKVSVPGGWDKYANEHPVGLGRQEVCELIIEKFNLQEVAERRATEIFAKCPSLRSRHFAYADHVRCHHDFVRIVSKGRNWEK